MVSLLKHARHLVGAVVIIIAASAAACSATAAEKPHVLFVVVDDFGWADLGVHRAESNTSSHDLQTPTMDALLREGVELNRHYVHMTCTPSRASLQSGRLPVHVLTQLASPCDKNGAIPRNITGIAAQLKKAGYATHQVGKWDAGMSTPQHTPQGRGYDSSLNYFGHGNWGYTELEWQGSFDHRPDIPEYGIVDFWDTDRPASHLNGTGYEELIFRDRMLQILRNHDQSQPLFLNYDSKIAHYPLQAPPEYQRRFADIEDDNRRTYHAMVAFLDDQLANITNTMRELGMWENTLMVLTSDNGGYVKSPLGGCNTSTGTAGQPGSDVGHGTTCFNGEAGANNWPLRGGKYSVFEGGIRVNAFVSGGFLPAHVRGSKLEGIIHIADWYGTLCGLAGVSPVDHEAAAAGLPPVDSVDVWPMLSGENMTSPRQTILVTENLLVHNEWKLIRGNFTAIESAWGGPQYPNASTSSDPISNHQLTCPPQGCLFNLVEDPGEHHEVSASHPDVVSKLQDLMDAEAQTIWATSHKNDPLCEKVAMQKYGGFYGPFLDI